MRASGMVPKTVFFRRSGNSIDADGTLRGYVLDKKIGVAHIPSNLLKEGFRASRCGNDPPLVGGDKLTPIPLLKLSVRLAFHDGTS